MPFSISRMIADGDQKVVALDWAYGNADGTLSNQHTLEKPYGDTPLADVTEELAITWLEQQLANTPEEFDAAIAGRKAAVKYEETLVAYAPHPDGPPVPIIGSEAEVEDEAVLANPGSS